MGPRRRREARFDSALRAPLSVIGVVFVLSACNCQQPMPDGGTPDASVEDAGTPDSGAPDSGTPDAGPPRDAGTLPDAGTLRCLSVACVGDTTCSTDTGECTCNGTVCQADQTCECPAGMPGCTPGERVCVTSTRCDGITCSNNSTCDLADGLCKCTGSGGPVCSETQTCGAARPPQCTGGCAQLCDRGLSCDPDDLGCKCGGRGGLPCSDDEICVSTPGQYFCRLPCTPVGGQCPPLQRCVIDTRPALDVAYCAFATGLLFEGDTCTSPTQCHEGHCAGLGPQMPFGTCRTACDPVASQCPAGRRCLGLSDIADGGFCVP